mgnify:FL=1
MKTFKTMVLAVAIICGTALSANTTEPTEPTAKTTSEVVKRAMNKEIANLLAEPNFNVEQTTSVKVSFTVNKDNEVVVLNVESKDASIEKYIQGRLNYQKLDSKALVGQTYHVPVKLESTL